MDDSSTRDKILSTSMGLFLKQGYDNTPIQAIIDAVGIAKGTFYHHFKSKDEMLAALVTATSVKVLDAIRPIAESPTLSTREKFLAGAQKAALVKTENFGPQALVLVKQMRIPANRRLAQALDTILTKWVKPFYADMIRQGVAEGFFHVRNPELAADLVLGVLMTFWDQITDLFLLAVEGDSPALETLVEIYETLDDTVERVLGAQPGSLPIYKSINIRDLIPRFASELSPGGNT